MQTQKVNWIRSSKTIIKMPFPNHYEYQEQIQVHEDGAIKIESYVSLIIGSFNLSNFKLKLPREQGNTRFMSKLNKALKIERVV